MTTATATGKTIYEELRDVLKDFKDFLDDSTATIKPLIQQLASMVPQVNDLIDEPIDLMKALKTEIQKIDVGPLGNLDTVIEFAGKISGFLDSAKTLLPDRAVEIDRVVAAAEVVSGVPSIGQVKTEIITLLDAIVADLTSLKS